MSDCYLLLLIVLTIAAILIGGEIGILGAIGAAAFFYLRDEPDSARNTHKMTMAPLPEPEESAPPEEENPAEEQPEEPVEEPAPKGETFKDKQAKEDKKHKALYEENRYALDQLYNRGGKTIDSEMTKHRQRIGDRDRQAIIAQATWRRNNTYEPYYRQELSDHHTKRWWEPDQAIIGQVTPEQLPLFQGVKDRY